MRMIFVFGSSSRMRLVSSPPSRPGITRSVITMSGRSRRTSARPSAPFAASPTKVVTSCTDRRRPRTIRRYSSLWSMTTMVKGSGSRPCYMAAWTLATAIPGREGTATRGGSSPSRARPFGPTGVPDRGDQRRCHVALVEEGIGALLERLAPGVVVSQVGEDQHLRVGPLALDLAGRFEPAEAGHHDVDNDDIRPFLADERDSHFAIGRLTGQRQIGVLPQDERHQPTAIHLVIDDENPCCHGRAPGRNVGLPIS